MLKVLPFTILLSALLFCFFAIPIDETAPPTMTDIIMAPSARVQITYGIAEFVNITGTGSGVAVACRDIGGEYEVYLLTAAHVVRVPEGMVLDNLTVQFFDDGNGRPTVSAAVIVIDEIHDIALIRAVFKTSIPVAVIASKDTPIRTLADVYVVGCKLGMVPMPTAGVITGLYFEEGMLEYLWGTSACAINGNSGGGVFLADGGELIGIMSRGAMMRGVPVEHMAFFVPLPVMRQFLIDNGFKRILGE